MKLAVSTISLPSFSHEKELKMLGNSGVQGIEVSPTKAWEKPLAVSPREVDKYRNVIESAGMNVVGIHSLFYGRPELGLFRDAETNRATMSFLVDMSRLCADLGGRTMVFGSGGARKRGAIDLVEADEKFVAFMQELAPRIEPHGTCIAIEPLAPTYSDYILSLEHALALVQEVDSPQLKVHIDVAAAASAGEICQAAFSSVADQLVHVHANELDLGVLGGGSGVDHQKAASLLNNIGYQGYCSLEQRMVESSDVMEAVRKGLDFLKEVYS